jgi:signal transduction histidine kinase
MITQDDRKDVAAPERQQTDKGLRVERERTDEALAEREATVEEDADLVVQRARQEADAVLVAARDKADQAPDAAVPDPPVARERAIADEAVRAERAAADETLRRERIENARILARLLPLERDETDRYLVTERARADAALSHRDDFLAIVSHDLRNLLGGVLMSAALLEHGAGENGSETLVETARIKRYVARMDRIIGDLLDVASIDAGKLAVNRSRGDARDILTEVGGMFQATASAKNVSLAVRRSEEPLLADFDHDRMLQVLANLLANAIKFTPAHGHVEVGATRAGDEVRVCVSDSGVGIPAANLAAIFDRFWQGGDNDHRGVGLGLYISKNIVEAHGGRIWAESTLGEGSRLYFTLPTAATV